MGQKEISEKSEFFLAFLKETYPEAKCALVFENDFQCLTAILLSAQATDKAVNKVTPTLWSHFENPKELSIAKVEEIENDIRSLGLSHAKAAHLKALGQKLEEEFDGVVPHSFERLVTLPGVGSKTAGVFLLERENREAIPVDTHIRRIASRLRYCFAKEEPMKIERKLERSFPKEEWIYLHHALIAFGREICRAQNPACEKCKMCRFCGYFKKTASTIGK